MGTDIHGVWQKFNGSKWEDVPSLYDEDRHYALFAWLGDVRNGYGFAGIPTHTPIVPLSSNRGYPNDFEVDCDDHPITSLDILPEFLQKYRHEDEPMTRWMGDHSHSWVTAEEILEAELPTIKRTGIITIEEFRKWDGKSQPESWSGGVSGRDVYVSTPDTITEDTNYVQIEWDSSLADEFDYFISEVKRLKNLHGQVRYVFGFDS